MAGRLSPSDATESLASCGHLCTADEYRGTPALSASPAGPNERWVTGGARGTVEERRVMKVMEWAAAWPLSLSTYWRYVEPPRDSVEPPQKRPRPWDISVEPPQKCPKAWDISVKPPRLPLPFSATFLLRKFSPLSARTGRAPSYPARRPPRHLYGQMNRLTAVRAGTGPAPTSADRRRLPGEGMAAANYQLYTINSQLKKVSLQLRARPRAIMYRETSKNLTLLTPSTDYQRVRPKQSDT